MAGVNNIVGMRFGRLVVIERAANKGPNVAWRCQCDCGGESVVRGDSLRHGRTESCGCLRSENARVRNLKRNAKRGRKRPGPNSVIGWGWDLGDWEIDS